MISERILLPPLVRFLRLSLRHGVGEDIRREEMLLYER